MNDVIKEQMVKLIRKYNRGGLIFAVIAGTILIAIVLLGCGAVLWFNLHKGMFVTLYIITIGLFGLTIGLWSAEGDLRKASISMGLWADKKELKKALKEK